MRQRRVLIIIDSLKSGGAEKVLIELLKKLDCYKYSIDLLLINKVGEYIENIPDYINTVSLIDTYNRNPSILDKINFRMYFNNPKKIKKILKKNYDIGVAFLEGDSTRILNELDDINYKVAWVHTDLTKHNTNINEDVYKNIDKIICVSQNAKNKFLEKYNINKSKVDVIYNGIDLKEINKLSNEYKVKFNSNINIVSVGRLVKAKGFDLLIKACNEILKLDIDIKLYIIGEGEERKSLENIIDEIGIAKSVELVGFKKNPYPYIKAADLCVSSSRYEGFSLFLAEAIILKKKIVSTKTQGAVELLKNGELGLLCECNDVDDITEKLISSISNYNSEEKVIKIIEERMQSFNQDKIIEKIDKILSI